MEDLSTVFMIRIKSGEKCFRVKEQLFVPKRVRIHFLALSS